MSVLSALWYNSTLSQGTGIIWAWSCRRNHPDTLGSWSDWQLLGISTPAIFWGETAEVWAVCSFWKLTAPSYTHNPGQSCSWGRGRWKAPSCTALSRAASSKWGGTEPCEQGQHHIPLPPWVLQWTQLLHRYEKELVSYRLTFTPKFTSTLKRIPNL